MTKLIFSGSNNSVQEAAVPEGGATVGRNAALVDIPIMDPSVSSSHAAIRFENGSWWLHDNNSSNGTTVNGREVKSHELRSGDVILFGNVRAEFICDASEQNAGAYRQNGKITGGTPITLKKPIASGTKPDGAPGGKDGEEMKRRIAESISEGGDFSGAEEAGENILEKFKDKQSQTEWKAPELKIDRDAKPAKMSDDDVAFIGELNADFLKMKEQLSQVIIGQVPVMEEVLMAVFSRGHALLVGVPGLAKTLLISTISKVLDLNFKRVQFTPDLMPSDITGTDVLEEDKISGERKFRFVKGPVFTNMLLADEINRTPPKTQAALLEAMQEHHITVGSTTYSLPEPFFVLATQNPIEQEGTYPLPEAQMDRFMFNIIVHYPTSEEESRIISSVTSGQSVTLEKIMDGAKVIRIQDLVKRVPVAPHVVDYARNLARATRPKEPEAPDFVKELVGWGAGPRAGISLIQAAKARAILHGRLHATTGDVTAVALPVLRHRVITTFAAEAAGVTSDEVVSMLVKTLGPNEDLDI